MNLAVCASHSVVSYSLWHHGLWPTRLLCPWNSPGKNTGVDYRSLLQTQGLNPDLLHHRQILYHLSYREVLWIWLHTTNMKLKEERNRPSWLHLEKEGNSILHSQWTLDYRPACTFSELWTMCLVAMGITYLWPNRPPEQINTRFHQDFPLPERMC